MTEIITLIIVAVSISEKSLKRLHTRRRENFVSQSVMFLLAFPLHRATHTMYQRFHLTLRNIQNTDNELNSVRFEVHLFSSISLLSVVVFWYMTPCGLVGGYHCFAGTCCLHSQGEVGSNLRDQTVIKSGKLLSTTLRLWEPKVLDTFAHVQVQHSFFNRQQYVCHRPLIGF